MMFNKPRIKLIKSDKHFGDSLGINKTRQIALHKLLQQTVKKDSLNLEECVEITNKHSKNVNEIFFMGVYSGTLLENLRKSESTPKLKVDLKKLPESSTEVIEIYEADNNLGIDEVLGINPDRTKTIENMCDNAFKKHSTFTSAVSEVSKKLKHPNELAYASRRIALLQVKIVR